MKTRVMTSAIAMSIALGGCGGGGGGGIASTPAPIVTTTNTAITDLRASQSFTNDATRTDVAFNTTSKATITGRAGSTPLTVSYDASSSSYAITGGGITDTFAPADRQTGSATGETKYMRRTGDVSSYLTLVTTPYYGTASNRYVGMGYAQRNTRSGDRQDTAFTTFTYGLDTPASGVPRTGSGTCSALPPFPGRSPMSSRGGVGSTSISSTACSRPRHRSRAPA
jgi:hypothetical protein